VVKYEIRYNPRNKRHVVFQVPEKKGLWKIKKTFKKKSEAVAWVKGQKPKTRKRKRKK